jgi:probable phosphoglycerate mutase
MMNSALPLTRILLIRHAHTDAVGRRLAGRMPGVPLSAEGQAEARALRVRLADRMLSAIYSSPQERAIDTAHEVAKARGLEVRVCEDMDELDFGEWTGRSFEELAALSSWRAFNAERATAPVPGGETASQVRTRVVRALAQLRADHPGETIAVVTHQDVIRTAVVHCGGGSLADLDTFEIATTSVTELALEEAACWILSVNDVSRDSSTLPPALRLSAPDE